MGTLTLFVEVILTVCCEQLLAQLGLTTARRETQSIPSGYVVEYHLLKLN